MGKRCNYVYTLVNAYKHAYQIIKELEIPTQNLNLSLLGVY